MDACREISELCRQQLSWDPEQRAAIAVDYRADILSDLAFAKATGDSQSRLGQMLFAALATPGAQPPAAPTSVAAAGPAAGPAEEAQAVEPPVPGDQAPGV